MRHPTAVGLRVLLWVMTLTLLAGCSGTAKAPSAAAKVYSFWPPAPDEPHIQFLVAYNNSLDIAPAESRFTRMVYGSESREAYAINKPYGVRMSNGCIYVCDVRAKGIMVLDLRKQQSRIMGATGATSITKAVDLAIAPDGTKYVVDAGQNAILVYSPDERFVSMFVLPNASPVGIAVFGDLLYVTDFKNTNVKVLDRKSGRELRTIGQRGGDDGQFIAPLGVAVDKQGDIYVSDTFKARVQKFAPDGKFLVGFGQAGNRPGDFIRPKYIGVDSDGDLHVVDASLNNVQVFDAECKFVGYYGASGRHAGAMDLPAGLDVHETDLDLFASYVHPAFEVERVILVANQFGNQKVSVYAMGHLKPGKTVADIAVARAKVETGLTPATQPAAQPATQPAGADLEPPSR